MCTKAAKKRLYFCNSKKVFQVFLLAVAFLLLKGQVSALTTSQWVDKSQDWMDALDNGSFTATVTHYEVDGETETMKNIASLYFEDDPSDGWKFRKDTTLYFGSCGSVVYKVLDTPDGDQAFLGSTCVYSPDYDADNSWVNSPHTSLPQIYFWGDPNETALQALQSVSDSDSASEVTLGGTSCYKLDITYDLAALNEIFADEDNEFDTENDSFSSSIYIRASDGQPIQSDGTITVDSQTTHVRQKWTNVDTNPSIPSGTFDLSVSVPQETFEEALSDWIVNNCE